jgi:hypothetical protein
MIRLSRLLGIALQALILGLCLFLAIAKMIGIETGARIFRYQAF